VLSSPDSLPALQYQRAILASIIELLDAYQRLVPMAPAVFVWNGTAQQLYSDELVSLREAMWYLRSQLDTGLFRLSTLTASNA
jgi:hypothetical protein